MKKLVAVVLVFITIQIGAQPVPMRVQEDGLFVKGSVNTITTDFMFDTGAGITVISSQLFQRIKTGLTYKEPLTGFRHDGERLDGDVYIAASITVGNFTARQVPVLVWPELDSYGLNAILSLQPFAQQPVSFDFIHQLLVIEDSKTLAERVKTGESVRIKTDVYRDLMLDIFVPLQLNDSLTIDAEFDTGTPADNLLIHPHYIMQLQPDTTGMEKQVYKRLSNGEMVYDRLITLPALKYTGCTKLAQKRKTARFRPGLIYSGLVGAGMFAHSVLTIDIANKRLLVNSSGNP